LCSWMLQERWHWLCQWSEPERYLPVRACYCWSRLKLKPRSDQSSWQNLVMTRWTWLKPELMRLKQIGQPQKFLLRRLSRKPGYWCRSQKSC